MDLPQRLCAIDLGSWTTKIAAQVGNHYEVLVNEANFRQTPSVVGYSDAERLIGETGQIKMKSNFKSTIRSPSRLLGLDQRPHIVSEELKYCTVKHKIVHNQLKFYPKYSGKEVETNPEEFLIGLMTKAKTIVESHGIFPDTYFLSIPTYLNNGERKALKTCAEAAQFRNINLVEQWQAISAQYIFFRQKELLNELQPRVVIFIDVGYTTFSVHACLVSKNEASLLQQETLRFSGSRNMDRLLLQFYEEIFTKRFNEKIQNNPKSLVKLMDSVENQRKKLSANTENHLSVECILGDNDLDYNMKRQQMEDILMPVFGEFATAMQQVKERVQMEYRIHSVEIIGGASRTPFFQEMAKNLFHMEVSKTMNTSETIARGTAISGAMRLGMMQGRTIQFHRTIEYPVSFFLHSLQNQGPFEKNMDRYNQSTKKNVFQAKQPIPANSIQKIQVSGPVQLVLFSEEPLGNRVIGYFQFSGQDSLAIFIDADKIVRVRLLNKQKFVAYDVGDLISVEKSVWLRNNELALIERDSNVHMSYELRNKLQALMYKVKESLSGEWRDFANPDQVANTLQMIQQNEEWLSNLQGNNAQQFKERTEILENISEMIVTRRNNHNKLIGLIKKFKEHYSLYSKAYKGKHEKLVLLNQLKEKFDELEALEISVYWDGSYLNDEEMRKILDEAEKIKK